MPAFPFELWLARKNKTEDDIVNEGAHSLLELERFTKERNLSMPENLEKFTKIWERQSKPVGSTENQIKKEIKVEKKETKTKPSPSRTRRTTRKKSHVKETEKK